MESTVLQDMQTAVNRLVAEHEARVRERREAEEALARQISEMRVALTSHLDALQIIMRWVRTLPPSPRAFTIPNIPIGQELADGDSPQYRPVNTCDPDYPAVKLVLNGAQWTILRDDSVYSLYKLDGLRLLARLDMLFVARWVAVEALQCDLAPPCFAKGPQDAPPPQDATPAEASYVSVRPIPPWRHTSSQGAY